MFASRSVPERLAQFSEARMNDPQTFWLAASYWIVAVTMICGAVIVYASTAP